MDQDSVRSEEEELTLQLYNMLRKHLGRLDFKVISAFYRGNSILAPPTWLFGGVRFFHSYVISLDQRCAG